MLRLLRGQSLFGPDFHKNIEIIIEKFESKPKFKSKLRIEIFYAEKMKLWLLSEWKAKSNWREF